MKELERVKRIITEVLCVSETKVTPDASLINELVVDSLDYLEILIKLETEFDIPIIEVADARKLETVGDIVKYIENILQVRGKNHGKI